MLDIGKLILHECLAFTPLWFHLFAHTADACFTQQYKLQMWQYMRDGDQIKLSINAQQGSGQKEGEEEEEGRKSV